MRDPCSGVDPQGRALHHYSNEDGGQQTAPHVRPPDAHRSICSKTELLPPDGRAVQHCHLLDTVVTHDDGRATGGEISNALNELMHCV
jgi:hypothetical protein